MANEPAVEEVREKLLTIVKLLAAQVAPDLTIAQRAPLLDRLGVDYETIATVCGTTYDVVRVRVGEARRAEGRGARQGANRAKAPAETKEPAEAQPASEVKV
jgi:hypothetical protein